MTRTYLVEDYAGGMMIRYEGRHPHVAHERVREGRARGAGPFVVVRASSRAEAWEKAEPMLLARKAGRGGWVVG